MISFCANAQNFKEKSSITLSLGASFAAGEFANKNLYDEKAGLASVGGYASIDYGYQFSKVFGAVVSLSGRIHGVDKNALQVYTVPSGSGASLSLSTTTWRFLRVVTGLSQTIPIIANEKLGLEIKELVGIQFSNSPEIQVGGFIPGIGSIMKVEESKSVSALAYGLSLGLKYKLAHNLKLKLFSEYQGSDPKFTYKYDDVASTYQTKQRTDVINVGLGVSFGF